MDLNNPQNGFEEQNHDHNPEQHHEHHNEHHHDQGQQEHGQHEGHVHDQPQVEGVDQAAVEEQIPQLVTKRRLGRGLDALLGGGGPANEPYQTDGQSEYNSQEGTLSELPLGRIQRNPNQPRKQFEKSALEELATSIEKHGVLQPVLVRELGENFELIAGERRWLAAKQAGLESIPCRVVDVIDKTACEFSFEENLKRKDLGDLEKAQAFRDYIDHFDSSIEELAKQLSMSRSAVSNTIRLLDLPVPIKNALQAEKLTAGHARALLSLKDEHLQLELAERVQKEQLSVRKTEAAAKELQGKADTIPFNQEANKPAKPELSNHLKSIQDQLRDRFGVKVELKLKSEDTGQIILHFANHDDFERLMDNLQGPQSQAA